MKKAGMRWLSILFLFIAIGTAFGAMASYSANSEELSITTLILGGIAIVTWIIFRAIWNKARWRCRCGGKGRAIDAEYLGSDVKWSDSSDGKSSTRRVTRKYLVTLECPECGKQWTIKTTKAGPTKTISY